MIQSPSTAPTPPSQAQSAPARLLSPYQRARILLVTAAIITFTMFWCIGALLRIPQHKGYENSLLGQPNPILDLLVIAVTLFIAVCLGTIVAGSIRYDAGIFSACLGLMALSYRGGVMHDVLHAANGPQIYLTLLAELIVLYAITISACSVQWFFHRAGLLHPDRFRDGIPDVEHSLATKLQATAVQVVVMLLLMLVLAQTDRKNQALAAVGISSFLATAVAHLLFPVRPSIWFWIGPLLVGIAGYAWAYSSPGDSVIGASANHLANALPLDYASMGPAAAILGYWMSRRWKRDREASSV